MILFLVLSSILIFISPSFNMFMALLALCNMSTDNWERLSKIIVSRFRGAEYFMRSAQFYAIAIFVTDRLCPPYGGGAEVMGAADELARKAVPMTSAP